VTAISEGFDMDAVLLSALPMIDPSILLPFVLSKPWTHPLDPLCHYALMLSSSLVLEVELGMIGSGHFTQLANFLTNRSSDNEACTHCRTDGVNAWEVC
jgi:hypothetical protein